MEWSPSNCGKKPGKRNHESQEKNKGPAQDDGEGRGRDKAEQGTWRAAKHLGTKGTQEVASQRHNWLDTYGV